MSRLSLTRRLLSRVDRDAEWCAQHCTCSRCSPRGPADRPTRLQRWEIAIIGLASLIAGLISAAAIAAFIKELF